MDTMLGRKTKSMDTKRQKKDKKSMGIDHTKKGTMLGLKIMATETEGMDHTKQKRMLKRVSIQKVASRSMDTMLGRKTKSMDTKRQKKRTKKVWVSIIPKREQCLA